MKKENNDDLKKDEDIATENVVNDIQVEHKTGVVDGCDMLNIRSNPTASAKNVIAVIMKGREVNVLDETGEFYKIEFDGTVGFAMKKFIKQ